MSAHNNFFIQQLLESRGTKLPSLDYLGFGEPTTYGTTFVYSEEVARSLQHPRVKKGTMNRGSGGPTKAPWAETVVQPEKMASVYGQDFVKSESVEERYNTETLLAKNKEMKKKQRAEALIRQEQLFNDSKASFEAHMSQERQRYKEAHERYENHESRVFAHTGISLRPKETEVERFAKTLDKKIEMEGRIRATVPRHISKTPEPTIARKGMMIGGGNGNEESLFSSSMNGAPPPPPRAHTVLGNYDVDDGEHNNTNTNSLVRPKALPPLSILAGGSSGNGNGAHPSGAVEMADKQRAKHAMLESQRIAKEKEALVARGWSEETDPRGIDKRPYVPETDDGGLGPEALSRVEAAVRKRKLEDLARREANAAERVNAQERLQAQLREMAELSKKPGIHPKTQRQFTEIMGELLKDSTAKITVPKNLGIVKPMADSEIANLYAQQQSLPSPHQHTMSVLTSRAVPLHGGVRILTSKGGVLPAMAMKGTKEEEEVERDDNDQPAGIKTNSSSPRAFNIINNANVNGSDGETGAIIAADAATTAATATATRPLRRTIHTHMPIPISQRTPMNPTRKDIDRELKTVVYGGHLLKDRSAAIKAMGPEKIAHVKSLNLGGDGNGGGGGAARTNATTGNNASGGGATRMAKPMVPPASVGKANLSLL